MGIMTAPAPTMQDLYNYFRDRAWRPVTFDELLSNWPGVRPKIRSRVCVLVNQGYIVKLGTNIYRLSKVYA